MRGLIYVPVVHSEAELGTLAGELRSQFVAAFGEAAWTRKTAAVAAMWQGIADRLAGLPHEWSHVRLYQDGLPVCHDPARIVHDLAAAGSANHRLLLDLAGRGATIVGTEHPELLLREYRRIQRLVQAARNGTPPEPGIERQEPGASLLRERDRFIAQRIDETLRDGETGILFLGLLHRVDELLANTVEIRPLILSLPLGVDAWRRMREGPRHGH